MLYQKIATKPNARRSLAKRLWLWANRSPDAVAALALAFALVTLAILASGCRPDLDARTADPAVRALACDVSTLRALDSCETQRLECGVGSTSRRACLEPLRVCRYEVEGRRAECYGAFDSDGARLVQCLARCENNFRGVEIEASTGRDLGPTYVEDAREARAACEVFCMSGGES